MISLEKCDQTQQQIAQNAAHQAWLLENYQDWATMSNVEVECKGFRHVRSMGIRKGTLAVQGLTNHAQVSDPPWQQPSIMMREATNGLV